MKIEKPEIMTAQEVAEFLRVSERTVYDWAASGTIPAGKLGTTWRFKRSEVEKWVDEQLSTSTKKNITFSPVKLNKILNPDHITLIDTDNKDTALMSIIDNLASSGAISNKEAVTEGIFQREKLMSTGIGLGIGIPHIRIESITNLMMAVGVSTVNITDYESLDGNPVRIIFMILAGKDQHALHIKTMAAISARLKNPLLRERLIESRDPKTIHSLLTDGEQ
ncbi:MAG: PTS sugar transporter subunit IIA [Sedimentisphaerales bacterium]|nr:PTS sugar transporter subunit IIA [Sedimentisphaerales bacterium]